MTSCTRARCRGRARSPQRTPQPRGASSTRATATTSRCPTRASTSRRACSSPRAPRTQPRRRGGRTSTQMHHFRVCTRSGVLPLMLCCTVSCSDRAAPVQSTDLAPARVGDPSRLSTARRDAGDPAEDAGTCTCEVYVVNAGTACVCKRDLASEIKQLAPEATWATLTVPQGDRAVFGRYSREEDGGTAVLSVRAGVWGDQFGQINWLPDDPRVRVGEVSNEDGAICGGTPTGTGGRARAHCLAARRRAVANAKRQRGLQDDRSRDLGRRQHRQLARFGQCGAEPNSRVRCRAHYRCRIRLCRYRRHSNSIGSNTLSRFHLLR